LRVMVTEPVALAQVISKSCPAFILSAMLVSKIWGSWPYGNAIEVVVGENDGLRRGKCRSGEEYLEELHVGYER
jgi:hypothetical protein